MTKRAPIRTGALLAVGLLAGLAPASAPDEKSPLPPEGCVRKLREARIELIVGNEDNALAILWATAESYPHELAPLLVLSEFHRRGALSDEQTAKYRELLRSKLLRPDFPISHASLKLIVEDRNATREELQLTRRGVEIRLQMSPEDVTLLDAMAALEVRLENLPAARDALQKLRALRSHDAILTRCLWLDRRLERWESALELTRELWARHGDDPLLRYLYLDTLSRLGLHEELLPRLEEVVGDGWGVRDTSPFLVRAGWALRDQGRDEEAERLFRAAKRSDPDHVEATAALLHLYGSADDREAGEAARVAELEQLGDADAWLAEGAERLAGGDARGAREFLRRAVGTAPSSEVAWFNLGLAALAMESWAEAADAFGRATGLNPERADSWVNLGTALTEEKRFAEAVDALRSALALRKMKRAYYYLWMCYKEMGQNDKAIDALERYNAEP
jgi:tetratricopeptide (TPR) repeat protein